MKNKHKVEPHIQRKINSGTCCFWWDDWFRVGPLPNYNNVSNRFNNSVITQFTSDEEWDVELVTNLALPQFLPCILAVQLQMQNVMPDKFM